MDFASRSEWRAELAVSRAELKDEVRSLQQSIRDVKTDVIKWMLLLWVATVALNLAINLL